MKWTNLSKEHPADGAKVIVYDSIETRDVELVWHESENEWYDEESDIHTSDFIRYNQWKSNDENPLKRI